MSPQSWSTTSKKISETISAAFRTSKQSDEMADDDDEGFIEVEWENVEPQCQSPIYLLVLGRSGSGKSYHIGNAFRKKPSGTKHCYRNTTVAQSTGVSIFGFKFRFIDTPGFDNPHMSDAAVLAEIGDYFLNPKRADTHVNGIVYIHQAGDTFRSRALARIFKALLENFIGSSGLPRLTICVACDKVRVADSTIVDELRHPGSVFSEAIAAGARIEMFDPERNGFQDVLKAYALKQSISLPIQKFPRMPHPQFVSRMEDILGCYEQDALQSRLTIKENRLRESFDAQIQALNSELDEKKVRLKQYNVTHQQNEGRRTIQDETIQTLNRKLIKSDQEYSSLRSQLQIQENFEQSEIVQELKDLNRRIDDIGRSLSAYLTDKYVFATFGKDFGDTTTQDARNLPQLKLLLGHTDDKPSLIASTRGEGMDVESFLDFSIRSLLCTLLHAEIFWPFHPSIPSDQSKWLSDIYQDIKAREPQAVAGKWRSNTFKSVFISSGAEAPESRLRDLMTEFLSTRLNPLIIHFFGQIDSPLEAHHLGHLRELMKVAWEWNAKLKGEIIMLGDFRVTAYGANFHPKYMEEFEPIATKPQAQYVLGTLGLGLMSQRAVGGGQPPVETVVFKALVVTENMYTESQSRG